jgi:beta-galactosidase GanA
VLDIDSNGFQRDGRPHRVLSGALHYARVHPAYWQDRLRRVRALGLNTVETYVPWNFHEPRPGEVDLSGWRDLPGFLREAQRAGLDAIVRPGPYICAEWEFGGLPAWLLDDTSGPLRLRTSDPRYLAAVDRWFDVLVPALVPLLESNGGPIVAMQLENEYGYYGTDLDYLTHLRDGLRARGVDCLLLTSDGPRDDALQGGTVPGALATVNYGSRPRAAFTTLRRYQPDGPLMCTEFWDGWFDHWGEPHHVRDADEAASVLDELLATGASVNLYMAHGGTSFGWWAGANHDGDTWHSPGYQPTTSSYDYDAPIGEAGELTPKFHAFRAVIARYSGVEPPPAELPLPARITPRSIEPTHRATLLDNLDALASEVRRLPAPEPMERLGQAYGLICYTGTVSGPREEAELRIDGLGDRARLFADGQPLGTLDRNRPDAGLPLAVPSGGTRLDVLVEAFGRVNYGPWLADRKGITGGVRHGQQYLHDWRIRTLPLDDLSKLDYRAMSGDGAPAADLSVGPAFHRAVARLDEPADAFVALPGWGRGLVWLNGFLLGRYWEIGPQRTLYAPAPLWRVGDNEIVVLELERDTPGPTIDLRDKPDLGETAPAAYS